MKVNVNIYIKNSIGVLELSARILGDPDAYELPVQVNDLITKGIKNFILDLSEVRSINSLGIGNIMECLVSVKRAGGQLKVAAVAEKIIDVLTLMEINKLIDIYEDVEDALVSYQHKL